MAQRHELIGESAAITRLRREILNFAQSDQTILVLGETGSGKEIVAHGLHGASDRRNRRLIVVNCPALNPDLMASELFGHAKGAFTSAISDFKGRFRDADGSTIFLDEIGDLPIDMQSKLLRVLQERIVDPVGGKPVQIDVRVLAATHKDLANEVAAGRFRQDLHERLKGASIRVPPLREHLDDIPSLISHFVNGSAVTANAITALKNYEWPGNVRELQNVIMAAKTRAEGAEIQVHHLTLPNLSLGGSINGPAPDADPAREAAVDQLDNAQRRPAVLAAMKEVLSNTPFRLESDDDVAFLLKSYLSILRRPDPKRGGDPMVSRFKAALEGYRDDRLILSGRWDGAKKATFDGMALARQLLKALSESYGRVIDAGGGPAGRVSIGGALPVRTTFAEYPGRAVVGPPSPLASATEPTQLRLGRGTRLIEQHLQLLPVVRVGNWSPETPSRAEVSLLGIHVAAKYVLAFGDGATNPTATWQDLALCASPETILQVNRWTWHVAAETLKTLSSIDTPEYVFLEVYPPSRCLPWQLLHAAEGLVTQATPDELPFGRSKVVFQMTTESDPDYGEIEELLRERSQMATAIRLGRSLIVSPLAERANFVKLDGGFLRSLLNGQARPLAEAVVDSLIRDAGIIAIAELELSERNVAGWLRRGIRHFQLSGLPERWTVPALRESLFPNLTQL